jgi:DNA-binding transcriptional LysR family regulator
MLKCRSPMDSMRAAYRAGRERFADLFVIPVIRKGDGRRMEMHQVRYFLAVADTLNFTRAAEQCHVSQPALTRAIQQLEEELGGLLLRREHKLTHLTDFGRLIEPHLRQLFADAEAAKSTARKFLSLQQAQIRLGVMCTIGPARFMGFLAGFRTANPGCELTLVEGVPSGLSRMLMAGELDLAVMAQPEPFSERLDVWPLYRERFGIAFPTGHRLETQNRVRITDVAEETYLRRINCEYRDYLADRLSEQGLAVRVGFQSEREDWIQMMVAAGFGVCFLPEFSPTIPGLRLQPVSDPEVSREVLLVSMSGRRFSPAVLTFIRAIRAHDWSPVSAGPEPGPIPS